MAEESKWETYAIFVPEGVQVEVSKFNQAQYSKFHKKPLPYKCGKVIELIQ